MNIKTKLSLQFTLIVIVILLFFSLLAYYFSFTSQRNNFRKNLLDRAKNTAILLIDVAEVDSTLLKKIHESTISWVNEEIVIIDSAHHQIYSNKALYLTNEVIKTNSIISESHFFSIKEKDGVCYKHLLHYKPYFVFVMAFDKARNENLSDLKGILLWSNLFSIWLSIVVSYFFSKNAMQPISRIIKNVQKINSSRLSDRLDEGNRKDEIAQLAITFNELLSNLEIVFKNQEDFVSNASHELRTPLAIMMVEADYLLNQKRNQEEYINHIHKSIDDLKKLNNLINSLLELALMNKNNTIRLSDVRIDEIIYNAIDEIKIKYEGRKIVLKIQYPENEKDLIIQGNTGLLLIAFKNLIENACKFSDEEVVIEFVILNGQIQVFIIDKGIGIPKNDMENIFKPFIRASNVKFKAGFGIGLALVSKIIELHKAELTVKSTLDKGTQVELAFNRKQTEEI